MSGRLREEIMRQCPEEFEDTLKDWIDKVENRVNDIAGLLIIDSTADLYKIEEAEITACRLGEELY